jgi:heme-degrading monooxygenase HmoA
MKQDLTPNAMGHEVGAGTPYASGNWHVTGGKEEEFIERWKEFLGWTRKNHTGLIEASLIRDVSDPSHFVSFACWSDEASRDGWRDDPEFGSHFAACRSLCDDFYGNDYTRTVAI